MADLKRLKHLRRMIKNIPKKNIAWSCWVTEWDDNDWTKCVMCPGAWIASDPFLNEGYFEVDEHCLSSAHGRTALTELKLFFDLPEHEVQNLFFFVGDAPKNAKKHKEAFLTVLNGIIDKYSYTN